MFKGKRVRIKTKRVVVGRLNETFVIASDVLGKKKDYSFCVIVSEEGMFYDVYMSDIELVDPVEMWEKAND